MLEKDRHLADVPGADVLVETGRREMLEKDSSLG